MPNMPNQKTTMLQLLEEFEAAALLKEENRLEEAQKPLSEKFFERYKNFVANHNEKEVEETRRQFLELYKRLK